jgi:beta-galactosidase beta subunit
LIPAYDNCILYTGSPTNYIKISPGEIWIVFPEDTHASIIGEGKIRKLFATVKIQ